MSDLLASPPAAPAAAINPNPAPANPNIPEPAGAPLGEAFSDLDQFASTPEEAAKSIDQQPPAPVRGKDGKFAPKEPPKEPEKKDPEPPKQPENKDPKKDDPQNPAPPKAPEKAPVSAPELRKAYETVKAERDTLKKEVETFKTAKPAEDPEKKVLAEKLTAAEKRMGELDETLRYTNYERSAEYAEKYVKPFEDAYIMGRKKVATLDVVERAIEQENEVTGEKVKKIIQAERAATEQDFDRLMGVSDDREARKLAKQLFGEDAAIAMQHREKVMELNETRGKALDEYKTKGKERETQAAQMSAKQREESAGIWDATNKAQIEKFPHYFAPIEGDEAGNKLLEAGYALADRAFVGDTSKIPPKELATLHATLRNRAAAFGRQVYLNKQMKAQVTALEAKIKELEESGPGSGEGDPKNQGGAGDLDPNKYGEAALAGYAHQA